MSNIQAPEVAPINPVPGGPGEGAVEPTQMRKPWRATVRTLFQALVALCTLIPLVTAGVYTSEADYPAAVVQVLTVVTAVARVMALPQVEVFLRTFLPFLSASGSQSPPLPDEDGATTVELAMLALAACAVVATLVLVFGDPFGGPGNGR